VFELVEPVTGINGIRIIGTEGGTASGGFLGVLEVAVHATGSGATQPVALLNPIRADNLFRFEFDSQAGVTHVVWRKPSLADDWQVYTTLEGDGTRLPVTDTIADGQRFYQVTSE
jgi:hypothetical protein